MRSLASRFRLPSILAASVGSGAGVRRTPVADGLRDINISESTEWRDVEKELTTAVLLALEQYVRRYPYVIIAPLMIRAGSESGGMEMLDENALRDLESEKLRTLIVRTLRPGPIVLQQYDANEGGYPYWHSEIYPQPDGEALRRVLLWTLYLTDQFEGGETEFFFQQRLITPEVGALLIAPAGFTHTHRGNRPRGGDKVIATSWILFR